jgi:hypothetical protein
MSVNLAAYEPGGGDGLGEGLGLGLGDGHVGVPRQQHT